MPSKLTMLPPPLPRRKEESPARLEEAEPAESLSGERCPFPPFPNPPLEVEELRSMLLLECPLPLVSSLSCVGSLLWRGDDSTAMEGGRGPGGRGPREGSLEALQIQES